MQSSSRSSSSPRRRPVPRSRVRPMRANGSVSRPAAAIRSRSTSGGSARGRGRVETGDVGGEQQPPARAFGPAPHGEIVEEAAEVDHGAFAEDRGHRLVAGHPATPGPAVVVGQEAFDVCSGQLGQAVHRRVAGGQVLGEGDQAVRAQVDGVRPQRGGHGGQIAQRDGADAGLPDGLDALGEGGLARSGHPRRGLTDPQLVAGLVEAEHPGGVVCPGVRPGAGRRGQGPGEVGEVGVGELVEGPAGGQADQAEGTAGNVASPVRAPPELLGDLHGVAVVLAENRADMAE